jgi:hypothetical protein
MNTVDYGFVTAFFMLRFHPFYCDIFSSSFNGSKMYKRLDATWDATWHNKNPAEPPQQDPL